MSERPLLLVDIDGVLNPYAATTCPDGYTEYDIFPEDFQPMRLAKAHGEWLRELGESFDVVWASGWGFDAHRTLSPILEIPEWPWVPFHPSRSSPRPRCQPLRHTWANGRRRGSTTVWFQRLGNGRNREASRRFSYPLILRSASHGDTSTD